METQKWLKRTKISFLVFLSCCLLLCVYLFYYEYTQDNRLWLFGLIGMCGWMFNPVPLIFFNGWFPAISGGAKKF